MYRDVWPKKLWLDRTTGTRNSSKGRGSCVFRIELYLFVCFLFLQAGSHSITLGVVELTL